METICPKICSKSQPKVAKSPLPVDVCSSKTSLLIVGSGVWYCSKPWISDGLEYKASSPIPLKLRKPKIQLKMVCRWWQMLLSLTSTLFSSGMLELACRHFSKERHHLLPVARLPMTHGCLLSLLICCFNLIWVYFPSRRTSVHCTNFWQHFIIQVLYSQSFIKRACNHPLSVVCQCPTEIITTKICRSFDDQFSIPWFNRFFGHIPLGHTLRILEHDMCLGTTLNSVSLNQNVNRSFTQLKYVWIHSD